MKYYKLLIFAILFVSNLLAKADDSIIHYIKLSKNNLKNGKYQNALNDAFTALSKAEKGNNQKNIMRANLQVGVAEYYMDQRNKPKILVYFHKAAEIAEKLNYDSIKPYIYHNIGAQYIEIGKTDSVEKYIKKALQGFDPNTQFSELSNLNAILSELYIHDSINIEKSLPYITNAIKYAQLSRDSGAIAFAIIKKGLYLYTKKKYHEAIPYFQRAEKSYQTASNEQGIIYAKRLIAWSLAKKYNDEVYNAFKEFQDLNDSVFNSQTASKFAEYETKFKTEKKERENKELLQENELKQQQLKNRNILIITLIILLLLIMIAVLWRRNLAQLKQNQEKLAAMQKIENERNRISRDLHDNVGSLVSFVNTKVDWILKNRNVDEDLKNDLSLVKNNSKEIINGLRDSIWTLSAKSITNFELVDKLKPYIKTHLLVSNTINDTISEEKTINNEIVLAIYRSCQEIINNINKHSHATDVTIKFYDDADTKLGIEIADNGIGIKQQDFEKQNHYGLKNLKSRLTEVGANIEYQTSTNGTKILLTI